MSVDIGVAEAMALPRTIAVIAPASTHAGAVWTTLDMPPGLSQRYGVRRQFVDPPAPLQHVADFLAVARPSTGA